MCDQQTPMEKYRASFSLVNKKVRGCKQGCTIRGKHAYVCMGKSRLDKDCFNKEGSTCNPKKINVCKTGVAKFGPTTDTSSRMARIKKIQNRVITKTRTNRGPFSGTQRGAYPRVNEKSNVTRGKPYYPQLFGKRNPRNLSGNKGTSGDYIYFKNVLPRMSYDGIVNTCGGGKVMKDDFEFEIPDNVGGGGGPGGGGGGGGGKYPTVNVPAWAQIIWKTEKDNTSDLKRMLDEKYGINSGTWQNYTFRWGCEAFQAAPINQAAPVNLIPAGPMNAIPAGPIKNVEAPNLLVGGQPVVPNVWFDGGAMLHDAQLKQPLGGPIAVMGPDGGPVFLPLAPIVPDGPVQCDALKGMFLIAQQELRALLLNDIARSGDIFADVLRKISYLSPDAGELLDDVFGGGGVENFKEAARLVAEGEYNYPDVDENGDAPTMEQLFEKALAESVFKIYKKLSAYFRIESLKNIDKNFNCELDDEECFDMLLSLLGKSVYWDYGEDIFKGVIERSVIESKLQFLSLTQCSWVKPLERLEEEENEIDVLLNGVDGQFTGLTAILDDMNRKYADQKNEAPRQDCEDAKLFPDNTSADYNACIVKRSQLQLDLFRDEVNTLYSNYLDWFAPSRELDKRQEVLARYPGSALKELQESLYGDDLAVRGEWCLLNNWELGWDANCGPTPEGALIEELKARLTAISGLEKPRLEGLKQLGKLDADNDGKKNWKDYAPLNKNIPNDSNPLFKAVTGLAADVVETIGEGVSDLGNVIGDGLVDASDKIRNLELDENGEIDENVLEEEVEELLEDGLEGIKDTVGGVITGITDAIAGPKN